MYCGISRNAHSYINIPFGYACMHLAIRRSSQRALCPATFARLSHVVTYPYRHVCQRVNSLALLIPHSYAPSTYIFPFYHPVFSFRLCPDFQHPALTAKQLKTHRQLLARPQVTLNYSITNNDTRRANSTPTHTERLGLNGDSLPKF